LYIYAHLRKEAIAFRKNEVLDVRVVKVVDLIPLTWIRTSSKHCVIRLTNISFRYTVKPVLCDRPREH